jgi:hypothetical protein
MNRFISGALLCGTLSCTTATFAQDIQQSYAFSRKNTFTLFAEYSNTSSHILLGISEQRKLADFGGAYTRRLVRFSGSDFSYHVEVRPVLFESDPLAITTQVVSYTLPPPTGTVTTTDISSAAVAPTCQPASGTIIFPPSNGFPQITENTTITCGRQWTFGQEFSPIGFKYSMRTRHPLQPFLVGTLGYMYTSRPVPVPDAEAFNFVFDMGAGIELYKSDRHKRSVALECRYHHFSNKYTAPENPGVDSIMLMAAYSFGR